MSITPSIAAFWDAAAGSFDEVADHGLHDPRVRDAWAARLASWLPASPADVLDLGCGTGSLALLMARHGHRVTGVDLSPNMAGHARRKLSAAGLNAHVLVGDAADPPPLGHSVDVILARHLLWTLPDPTAALQRWIALSRPGGRLVLIEGRWNTGQDNTYVEGYQALPWTGGVTAQALASTLQPLVTGLRIEPLTDPGLWGRTINDERYAIIATI
ncbi:MAG: putative SAM-dependent methyltransferase [Actinomycetia bacterium]|nr:putative SAM-dependent methyltransferase [Actinomycetes bacterium]